MSHCLLISETQTFWVSTEVTRTTKRKSRSSSKVSLKFKPIVSNRFLKMQFLSQYIINIAKIHLTGIDKELGLVMITEYSDESNILLRRKMCWDMSDILYISINLR